MVAPSTGHFSQWMRHRAWRGWGAVHMPRWMQTSTTRWLRVCLSSFNNRSLWLKRDHFYICSPLCISNFMLLISFSKYLQWLTSRSSSVAKPWSVELWIQCDQICHFCHFGKILKVFGHFMWLHSEFGKILNLLLQLLNDSGQIFIAKNRQRLKTNLATEWFDYHWRRRPWCWWM